MVEQERSGNGGRLVGSVGNGWKFGAGLGGGELSLTAFTGDAVLLEPSGMC